LHPFGVGHAGVKNCQTDALALMFGMDGEIAQDCVAIVADQKAYTDQFSVCLQSDSAQAQGLVDAAHPDGLDTSLPADRLAQLHDLLSPHCRRVGPFITGR